MEFSGHSFSIQICQRRRKKKKKKGISKNISYLFKGQQKGCFLHRAVAMPNFKSGFQKYAYLKRKKKKGLGPLKCSFVFCLRLARKN